MTIRDLMPFTWNRDRNIPVTKGGEKTPMRRDPFELFHKEFDEMFETFRREFGELTPGAGGEWAPKVNIRETDSELVVEAELPGLEEKDLKLSIENGVLAISGERKHERKHEKDGWHRYESSYGRFARHIALPDYVSSAEPQATLKQGVLTVSLKKTEKKTSSQSIPVQAG